jgi:hypothetical protein
VIPYSGASKAKIILGGAQDNIVFFRCLFIPRHDRIVRKQKTRQKGGVIFAFGGERGIRTPDPAIAG